MSSEGTTIAAVVGNTFETGNIFVSTDSGVVWTENTSIGRKRWNGVTISADGTKMASVCA